MYRDNYGLFWFEKCIDLLSSHFSLFYFVSEMDRLVRHRPILHKQIISTNTRNMVILLMTRNEYMIHCLI
jgi:hypothetical protein